MAPLTFRTASSRQLGSSENNWCLAVEGGTGYTVVAILFGQRLKLAAVEASLRSLLASQPLLRAEIVQKEQQLWFEIADEVPDVKVAVLDRTEVDELDPAVVDDDEATEQWLAIVEEEMNKAQKPLPVFQARIYNLPKEDTLLLLRLHSAVSDMHGTSAMVSQLLRDLKQYQEGDNLADVFEKLNRISEGSEEAGVAVEQWNLPSIESAVPPEKSKKPFWAHGVDALGYGLVSRRFAYLPFENTEEARKTRLIRTELSREHTDTLLQAIAQKNTDLYGVLVAAWMKATAQVKKTGNRGEHYAAAVLYNCRASLNPVVPADAAGFYNSALLKTTHVKETDNFWQLAAKSTKDFNDLLKNNKQFTDMGVLAMFMVQAIHHPGLTPYGSMRTALVSLDHSAPAVDLSAEVAALQVKDRLICSSTHGVGPCLGLFYFLEEGRLRFSVLFPSPLFSRKNIKEYVEAFEDILISNLS